MTPIERESLMLDASLARETAWTKHALFAISDVMLGALTLLALYVGYIIQRSGHDRAAWVAYSVGLAFTAFGFFIDRYGRRHYREYRFRQETCMRLQREALDDYAMSVGRYCVSQAVAQEDVN